MMREEAGRVVTTVENAKVVCHEPGKRRHKEKTMLALFKLTPVDVIEIQEVITFS
jgi:hypothetical protein